jgi:hypothetical protein
VRENLKAIRFSAVRRLSAGILGFRLVLLHQPGGGWHAGRAGGQLEDCLLLRSGSKPISPAASGACIAGKQRFAYFPRLRWALLRLLRY